MKFSKFISVIISAMIVFLCAACEDKDNDKSECKEAAECTVVDNAAAMKCTDGKCAIDKCADNFKLSEDAKACVADEVPKCECDPECKDTEECVKGEADKCECKAKAEPKTCDPVCPEGKECKCTEDKCDCADVTPAKCDPVGTPTCATECKEDEGCICQDDEWKCVPKNTVEECFCDEEKTVKCPEGGKEACEAKPAKSCEPACTEDKECACADDKCECVDKAKEEPVDECFCDEEKTVKCPDGGKDACAAEPTQPVPVE